MIIAISALCLLAIALGLNYLVDPLYYFGGDKIYHESNPYDGRIATLARYRFNPGQYDCIILGSSRTTFLDAHVIKGHRCANFSIVGAGADTVFSYADYVRHVLGINPKLVIVGVDGFKQNATQAAIVPDFVQAKAHLPSALYFYSSLDVSLFSLKHLLKGYNEQIFSDRNFRKHQTIGLINANNSLKARHISFIKGGNYPLGYKFLGYYQGLHGIFPHARLIGFVPPIAPAPIEALYQRYGINGFFKSAYAFSTAFDDFYDFSVPSAVTQDLSRTYDGVHYTAETYDVISDVIFNGRPNFGIHVTGLSFSEYKAQYIHQMKHIFGESAQMH